MCEEKLALQQVMDSGVFCPLLYFSKLTFNTDHVPLS